MPFCTACGTENPASARFCAVCGAALVDRTPLSPPGEERKVITAVFVDLVDSTARSEELDPEDVKALVAPYHARVRRELERHGGTFEKFSGDAVLALFGFPQTHEDDAERAVRAALAVRGAIGKLNAEDEWLDLHFRIGMQTGEALVMLGARPSEGEWSAAGDVLNTAARIQAAAPTDQILVGRRTYLAAKEAFEFREAIPIRAKGKSALVAVWEVVAARDGAPAARPRGELPLVGRQAELAELSAFCEAILAEGRVGATTILGSPGIGKSRLLLELVRRLEDRSDVHWGRCLSYGEGITYWPIEEVVKDAAGILHDDDAETTSAKLASLLETLGTSNQDELRTIAAAVSNLVGVSTTPQRTYSAAEIGQTELHWGIRRLLELRAARRPTVVVLEDLHWAEPTLLELLAFIAESQASVPLLVLATARREATETASPIFVADGGRRMLELDALSAEESVALIGELVPEGVHVPVERVCQAAGGNPLFLEETVRMLAEAEALAGGEELPVPSSLQALIASRLDRLGAADKRLAQNASVIGARFWPRAVAAMSAIEGDPQEALAELERRDLIRSSAASSIAGEREYEFKHVLIRDVAYAQLPKGRRGVLHRRFAEWVAALPGGEDEFSEIVAYHLEQACLTARTVARPVEPAPLETAVAALVRAASKAERREGYREADRFYVRALDLAEERDTRLELRLNRCRSLTCLGNLPVARKELLELLSETVESRRDLRFGTLVALANIESKQGHATEARAHVMDAHGLAKQLGDRRLEIRALYESSDVRAWFEGEDAEAIDDLRAGLAISEELDDHSLRIEGHMRLGFVFYNLGELRQSEQHAERCAELSREVGDHRDEARVTVLLAQVKYYRGELELARSLSLQALEWLERTGDSYFQIQNLASLATYALAASRLSEAEERLKLALPLALESGGWLVLEIYRLLVETLVRQGRLEEARELVAFAARNVPEEDAYSRAALLMAKASIATAEGDGDAALGRYPEALLLLEEQRLLIDLAEGRLAFGRALRRFERHEEAEMQFRRAFELVEPMAAHFLVAEIERELPGIGRSTRADGDRRPAIR